MNGDGTDPATVPLRQRRELLRELRARAQAWLPEWQPRQGGDFGLALLEIAARLGAEVTQRLDRVPDKAWRDFVFWLGLGAAGPRAARLPVVFNLAPKAGSLDAPAPVQLQAQAADAPVMLETEQSLRLVAARLVLLLAADPEHDHFFAAPAPVLGVEPPEAVRDEWLVMPLEEGKAQAAQDLGLAPGLVVLDAQDTQHVVQAVDKGIVRLEPALAPGAGGPLRLRRAVALNHFDPRQLDGQRHALYIGSDTALELEAPAVIELRGTGAFDPTVQWAYWGIVKDAQGKDQEPDWQRLDPVWRSGGRLLLFKGRGRIEPRKVEGRQSRWLRASLQPAATAGPAQVSSLRLLVNDLEQPLGSDGTGPAVPERDRVRLRETVNAFKAHRIEGIAGTTPLVMDRPFYPLGREPRLFDAFYLGWQEAFSKPRADVRLDFDMGDRFSSALAAVRQGREVLVVAIGSGGGLQRLAVPDTASQPPSFAPSVQPLDDRGRALTLRRGIRPGVGRYANQAWVSVIDDAGNAWLFNAAADAAQPWTFLGQPAATVAAAELPDVPGCSQTLLQRAGDGASLRVLALVRRQLWQRDQAGTGAWQQEPGLPPELSGRIVRLVPVQRLDAAPGDASAGDGLAGITDDGLLFHHDGSTWHINGMKVAWEPGMVPSEPVWLDPGTWPLAVRLDAKRVLVISRLARSKSLVAVPLNGSVVGTPDVLKGFELKEPSLALGTPDGTWPANPVPEDVPVLFAARPEAGGEDQAWRWHPFSGQAPTSILAVREQQLVGAPVSLGARVLVPLEDGSVFLQVFEPELIDEQPAAGLADALLVNQAAQLDGPMRRLRVDLSPPKTSGIKPKPLGDRDRPLLAVRDGHSWSPARHALVLDERLESAVPENHRVALYRALHDKPIGGERSPTDKKVVELSGAPEDVQVDDVLEVLGADRVRLCRIVGVAAAAAATEPTLTLDSEVPDDMTHGGAGKKVRCLLLRPLGHHAAQGFPAVRLERLKPLVLARLGTARLTFPAQGFTPRTQPVADFFAESPATPDAPEAPETARWAVLALPWNPLPDARLTSAAITVDAGALGWVRIARAGHNPELSWEYWNGTGWSALELVHDGTAHLERSGPLCFKVPPQLQPVDVAGHTNHWVRARLVGGDYGQEKVELQDLPSGGGHKVVRDPADIHAPQVTSLALRYVLDAAVAPQYVLAEDNGAVLDFSAANRTQGAVVTHFVPLGSRLAELDPAGRSDGGQALYLGFDAPLDGGPVSLLFLVDEGEHDDAFPLRVEALRRGGFEPVPGTEDRTRGLNESGTLVFTLSEPTLHSALFGREGHWLRLRPRDGFAGEWKPRLRGAWLNGTWAAAAQTRELEPLGSSDGSPGQRLLLARPPVVAGSLVLRVREDLGEEEVRALRAADAQAVQDELAHRPGPWVRWRQVSDTDDAEAGERVYALDEASGEICFGDGRHGRIPPIGRDVFMAQTYRSGGGSAANAFAAWSPVNLLTPLQGVAGVFAPEQAGGGSDTQSAAAVLRFAPGKLAARGRVLTARDLELRALQFDAAVAQARALSRPGGGVRLVVLGRAPDGQPTRALRRELRAHLLGQALPALAQPGALDLTGPQPLPLRLTLGLAVERIDHAGTVSVQAEAAVRALLDPATGGLDAQGALGGRGWPLGQLPGEADVVAALAGLPHLVAVTSVRFEPAPGDDGQPPQPLPATLRPSQWPWLPPGGVRFGFDVGLLAGEKQP